MRLRTHYTADANPSMSGETVTLVGWMHESRDLGGILFLLLRDRTGVAQITLVKEKVSAELFEVARSTSRESTILVRGVIKEEGKAPSGFEILPEEITVLNAAESPLPLDPTEKVEAELDTRLDARYMDLRRHRINAMFQLKSEVLTGIREYLREQGFVEINTPKIVATATEGGTALFPMTYFNREAFLNQSPQLFKQMMMSAGLDRVFEIAPIFRAEEHDTRRHLNEVVSIDIEVSFVDHNEVMEILENLIAYTYSFVKDHPSLKALELELEVPKTPFKRITYQEAIDMVNETGVETLKWGDDFGTAAEKALGNIIGEHYFIVDWPTEIKPFYAQPYEDRPEFCKAFDLMHPKMEMASGAQRVHELQMLKNRLAHQGLEPDSFQFYLDAFRYGMPSHAGWGLGLERVLMTMTGVKNIREVVIFPRDRKRLAP